MAQWLLILGAAAIGGMLVLNAFGKTKSGNDCMLKIYVDLLDNVRPPAAEEESTPEVAGPQSASDADETAPPPE
jgi:hypothetical protein